MWKGRNIFWAYLSSILFWTIGMVAAYLLVTNFCSLSPKSLDTNTLKVDSPVKAVSTLPYSLVPDSPENKMQPVKDSKNIFNLQLQAGRRLPSNNPSPIQAAQAVKNAADLSYNYTIEKIKSRNVWTWTFAALLILIVAFFTKKDSVLNAREKDKDPDEVKLLFKEFEHRINLFRNPRKVLRFLNLVKYHYYFLAKNEIGTMDNLRKMMWILLEIQDNREFVNIKSVNREELSNASWFYKRIKSKPWYVDSKIKESDKELLMIILKLNVDMGS